MLIILPNYVSEEIDKRIDEALKPFGEVADNEREQLRQTLINHFAETGEIAEFNITKNQEP